MEMFADSKATCPLGNNACHLFDEVSKLRAERDRLAQLSITDSLTGLFNLRHLMHSLDQEMERTRRTGLPTGVIMADLDHFKEINDSFGHQVGDMALEWVSSVLRDNVRRIDIVCRYGGEEFTVILPGTGLSQAIRLAERLRSLLEEQPLRVDDDAILLTASFGVVAYRGQNGANARSLLDCADQMLFRAKVRGRNLVCCEPIEKQGLATEVTVEERAELFRSRGIIESTAPCLEHEEED